ncbi:ATP-binding protein [Haliangium sp.]|uniref:PAS domain-containing hybrid sensor histidine kinase/response regulator n=1 Tax=Haliangium sp. TaxID=2663208 RepID=UPI003D11D909
MSDSLLSAILAWPVLLAAAVGVAATVLWYRVTRTPDQARTDDAHPPAGDDDISVSNNPDSCWDRSFLRQLIDELPDPMFVKDREHRWLLLNSAFCRFIGQPREALVGKSDFDFFPAEEAQEFWDKDELVFESGEGNVNVESFTDAAGTAHTIETKKNLVIDEQGQKVLVGVIRDLTELKRAEAELRAAKDTAEAATQAKSTFLAGMSHEVRTPLNAVLGMTRVLLEGELDSEQREALETIRDSGDGLLRVVNDILDLSQVEAGKVAIAQEPFAVEECLERAIRLAVASDESRSTFTHRVDASVPPQVCGDAIRVRQVLINLLHNASKFTDAGTISVEVVARPLDDVRSELHFSVKDDGVGISANRLDEIFEPFHQASATHGGSGLGLAICRQLCELMNGHIWAESEEGRGSTFHFTVTVDRPREITADEAKDATPTETPAAESSGADPDAAPVEAKSGASADDTAGASCDKPPATSRTVPDDIMSILDPTEKPSTDGREPLRLLLAEDNLLNQKLMQRFLESIGYGVEVVENGADALAALQARPFDVVLMDVQMPKMDGLTATRRIRAELPDRTQPTIIGLTAGASASDRQDCLDAGMDEYLSKPIALDDLRALLNRCERLQSAPDAK